MALHRRAFVLLAALAWLAACDGKPAPKPGKEVRVVRLDGLPAESSQHGLFGPPKGTHRDLIERLVAAAKNPQVVGVLLEVSELHGAWARMADVRAALRDLRKARKPVHCHFEVTDNLGYALLASSCDRISIAPAGMLELVGVSTEAVYAHKLLQNVGLQADVLQIGDYKGTGDSLTRDDMPAPVRETLSSLLDDLQGALLAAVGERGIERADAQALVDRGPYTADDALAAKLVDAVEFEDASRAQIKLATKANRLADESIGPEPHEIGLTDLMRLLFGGHEEEKHHGKRLVVAYLDGTIMRGSRGDFRGSHAESFVRGMKELGDDADVRAVVLRIDSPGGSALAADLMWHAVRTLAQKKPVIVSIGNLCASGGYYVASAGTEILAQNESIVGSIGVVAGKAVFHDLAERVGVHVEQLGRGKHAGWTSASRPFSADERATFEHALRDGYARFVQRIAEGRHLTPSQIEPFAEGRIMTARRAREGRLIDGEGSLEDAVALARKRGNLPSDAPIETWPGRPSLVQALSQFGADAETRSLALDQLGLTERVGAVEWLLAGDPTPAAVLPFALSIR